MGPWEHNHLWFIMSLLPAPQQQHVQHLFHCCDLCIPAESLHTGSHCSWLRRKTKFIFLAPSHPYMTWLCIAKHFSITLVTTTKTVKFQSNKEKLGTAETRRGHQWWDRQEWNRLKRREEHRSVNDKKKTSKSISCHTFPVPCDPENHCSWLSKDLQIPLPCQALFGSLLLISSVTYCYSTSGSQVVQVCAMA